MTKYIISGQEIQTREVEAFGPVDAMHRYFNVEMRYESAINSVTYGGKKVYVDGPNSHYEYYVAKYVSHIYFYKRV